MSNKQGGQLAAPWNLAIRRALASGRLYLGRRYQIAGGAWFINRSGFCNPGRCNFAGFDLLDGPLRAQPLTRFLAVETQTGSFRGLKPKPDLPTVSRPSNKGPESSAQAVGSGPFALTRAPRPGGGAQGALYLL